MSEQSSREPAQALPDDPSLEWLRKQAKRRLEELRQADPSARLASAQLALAREHGFSSWRALKAHVDSLSVEGRIVGAAKEGDVAGLEALLDEQPERLRLRTRPYGWTLLHVAAHAGQAAVVDALLRLGLDVDAREQGDNTTAMHWAAAGGHLDVVRRLVEAGGDVVGHGDEHELEVIGWATCWDGCDDDAHRAVAELLLSRGARHHVFSAIAMNLADEVRRIVAADPAAVEQPMSRHEQHRRPLHFAVRMNRPEMVALLLDLGADPTATDALGAPAAVYAALPEVGREVIATLAARGALGLFGALALGDFEAAARLVDDGGDDAALDGLLHLLAKRGDADAVRWLLDRGADPNARWSQWDAEVAPLHLAAAEGHVEVVRLLLEAGADPSIRDSKHDGDAVGWAQHGRMPPSRRADEVVAVLREIEESLL
jgi:ankyrin repeat protein